MDRELHSAKESATNDGSSHEAEFVSSRGVSSARSSASKFAPAAGSATAELERTTRQGEDAAGIGFLHSRELGHRQQLAEAYRRVRRMSERLCESLELEDFVAQSMPDASPTRWHLAHTTWFFETFVLAETEHSEPHDDSFRYLFNSYYNQVGEQFPRARRGLITRPTVADVFEYRRAVDSAMEAWLNDERQPLSSRLRQLVEVGLHHEQQHQELILTDIKHLLAQNPLAPAFRPAASPAMGTRSTNVPAQTWFTCEGGLCEIGHAGVGFGFDNEFPRHEALVQPCQLSSRLVTAGEYLEFMEAGGYQQPQWWLSLGWATVQSEGWEAPLYWQQTEAGWQQFTLTGLRPVDPAEPVCHISLFEADAFARWRGCRLPTEFEWEAACAAAVWAATDETRPSAGHANFVEAEQWHPASISSPAADESLQQMLGDVWEWTSSPYVGYPGYQPPVGAIGEYNGKFMCNQYVLRGGSCATSQTHIRPTYRNFFPPEARWQFTGFRLARDHD